MASFPMDELRDYRSREVHGNAYRRPEKYHMLISDISPAAEFIRDNNKNYGIAKLFEENTL